MVHRLPAHERNHKNKWPAYIYVDPITLETLDRAQAQNHARARTQRLVLTKE